LSRNKELKMDKSSKDWLSLWSLGVILFGLVLAGAGFAATDGIAAFIHNVMGPAPFAPSPSLRFSIGLMGAVTMGWGGTLYVAFKALHSLGRAQAAPIWRMLIGVVLAWYGIDSAISAATGFWMNAVSNTLLTILLLIPILRSGVMQGTR
jgi:hypothetical protein